MRLRAGISSRIYQMLLIAYPSEFRREYGDQMVQVFRDRYRNEVRRNSPWSIAIYWFRTLSDLVATATRERLQNFGKDRQLMNNLRRDIITVVGTIAIIVAALALLSYGRSHEVSSILAVGQVLDAIVTAGVVGNLIVFSLVKFTKWNSLRLALWTFVAVHAVLVIIIAMLGPQVEPQFRLGPIILAYVLSFLFWFGLHWAWRFTRSELAKS